MMWLYYDKDYDLIVSNGDKISDWWFNVNGKVLNIEGVLELGKDTIYGDAKLAFPLEFMQ